jgi:hypothetical protein
LRHRWHCKNLSLFAIVAARAGARTVIDDTISSPRSPGPLDDSFIDWLDAQAAQQEADDGSVRHIRLALPLRVAVDTAKGRGTISVPNAG